MQFLTAKLKCCMWFVRIVFLYLVSLLYIAMLSFLKSLSQKPICSIQKEPRLSAFSVFQFFSNFFICFDKYNTRSSSLQQSWYGSQIWSLYQTPPRPECIPAWHTFSGRFRIRCAVPLRDILFLCQVVIPSAKVEIIIIKISKTLWEITFLLY